MGKSTRTHHMRERTRANAKQSKQTTLNTLTYEPHEESAAKIDADQRKQIAVTRIDTATREDELSVSIEFLLFPSRTAFSKIAAEVYFDEEKLRTILLRIPQSPLAADTFELRPVLNMKGINAGPHRIRIEMYEPWPCGEKLAFTSQEETVRYAPKSEENHPVKVPIVKRVSGTNLSVASESEKDIYREIEESIRKEIVSKRDEW